MNENQRFKKKIYKDALLFYIKQYPENSIFLNYIEET